MISVVIPTYRRHTILTTRALPSVLDQTMPVDEILVIHDGNDEYDVFRLQQEVAALEDGRIKVLAIPRQRYPEDPGQRWCVLGLEARNYGLDLAQGDWIAPLDDDDEWTSDHIEILMDAVIGRKADFAYGVSKYHWPDNRLQFAGRWPPGMGSFCDGAQLYKNNMGYRYDWGCIERGLPEDGDLWTRMYEGGVKMTFINRLVHHYYPNPR